VQTSLALFRRIYEYLDLVPAIQDRPGAVDLDPARVRGEVELDRVWFAYPPPPRFTTPPPAPGEGRGQRGGAGLGRAMAARGVAPGSCAGAGGAAGPGPRGAARVQVTHSPQDEAGTEHEAGSRQRPWAVRDVSFRIEPGQLAAFVGPSGAGKTTLSHLVPRLYEVDRGAVRV